MKLLGLNFMNKQELREKLKRDAEQWQREHGKPDLIAAPLSPQEHFRLCGYKYKRKVLRVRDARQDEYTTWLEGEKRLHSA